MRNKLLTIFLVALAFGIFSVPAYADSFTLNFNGVSYALTTTGNTGTLTVNPSGCTIAGCTSMGDVAFKFGSSFTSIASSTGPAGYVAQAGGLNNGGCNTTGSGFVCFNTSSNHSISSGPYVFTITLNGLSALSGESPSVKTQFFNVDGVKVDQVSEELTLSTTPPPTTVPEPASLTLLGSGLLTMSGFLRKKLKR